MFRFVARVGSAAIVGLIVACSICSAVHAGTDTWTGGGSDGNWSNGGNWNLGFFPVNGDDVHFTGTTGVFPTDDIASLTLNSMTLDQLQFHFAINGGSTLNLSGSGISNTIAVFAFMHPLGTLEFTNSASGSSAIQYYNEGATQAGALGGQTLFFDLSNAGSGAYANRVGVVSGALGGQTVFNDYATAGTAQFVMEGSEG